MGVEPQVELECHAHALQDGDLLLLCSDGLSDMVSDADLLALCQSNTEGGADLGALSQALVNAANERVGGGRSGSAPSKPWWGLGRR